MSIKPMVLIVEDDETIGNFIAAILGANGYDIVKTKQGKAVGELIASHVPDIVLLDLGLPDIDGMEVLKGIRAWSKIPVIVVTARSHEREKVEAFDLEADDYIVKPFGTSELLARIKAALRHNLKLAQNGSKASGIVTAGEMEIDEIKRTVTLCGERIHLTPTEYRIIVLLAQNIGKVLTHDFIVKEVWGPYANEKQALRVNMANIRRKIESNPGEPKYILTEMGVGYRMAEEVEQ
jgi:two-component system, OmpR family, KDP operon response regulator KdpE